MIIDNEDSEYENRLKTRLDILQSALKNRDLCTNQRPTLDTNLKLN